MIPTIGFMVAALGGVVCIYVAGRAVEVAQRETTGRVAAGAMWLVLLAALSGLFVIGVLATGLSEQSDAATQRHEQRSHLPAE